MNTFRLAALLLAATFALSAPAGADATAPLPPVNQEEALWTGIKDITFDTRAAFFTGRARLEARLDAQISELTARRAAMKSDANTKDWDFAMNLNSAVEGRIFG